MAQGGDRATRTPDFSIGTPACLLRLRPYRPPSFGGGASDSHGYTPPPVQAQRARQTVADHICRCLARAGAARLSGVQYGKRGGSAWLLPPEAGDRLAATRRTSGIRWDDTLRVRKRAQALDAAKPGRRKRAAVISQPCRTNFR